jgi:hypothetical protein
MANTREKLAAVTKIVADTGDLDRSERLPPRTPRLISHPASVCLSSSPFHTSTYSSVPHLTSPRCSIKSLKPVDATTNPSLILAAVTAARPATHPTHAAATPVRSS